MRRAAVTLTCLLLLAARAPDDRARAADPRLATTIDLSGLPAAKVVTAASYLTAIEAARYLAAFPDIVLIDIRDPDDVRKAGLPRPAARNIPLYFRRLRHAGTVDEFEEHVPNPGFVAAVRRLLGDRAQPHAATVLLICWKGTYSAHAAALLAAAGYEHVYSIVDGTDGDPQQPDDTRFPGWRAAGLAWQHPPRAEQTHLGGSRPR